jgi:membrane-associated phospholipid phosphatase
MYLTLASTSALMAVWRRSVWPVAFGLAVAGGSAALTVVVKLAFERPDPHGYLTLTGGSYPSGHVVAVVACLSGCLLVVWPRVRWWLWAPAAVAAALMSASLLVAAAHWPTDVVGGALLAVALVSALSRSPLRRRACESRSAAMTEETS